jgi:glycosyltransferase involved in cell wall biosynthesis
MKKVVLLSYFYIPGNFAGSMRIAAWARYLSEYGYYPVVITRHWDKNESDLSAISTGTELVVEKKDNYEIHYLPYKGNYRDRLLNTNKRGLLILRKVLSFAEIFLQNFFVSATPMKFLYYYSQEYLEKNKDVEFFIISTTPFVLFHFGYLLAKKRQIKWIADYRDPWTTEGLSKIYTNRFIWLLEHGSEKRWLRSASAFITCSETWKNEISAFIRREGFVVNNGYDEDFPPPQNVRTEEFIILHIGTMYKNTNIETFISSVLGASSMTDVKIVTYFIGIDFEPLQAQKIRKLIKGHEKDFILSKRIDKNELLKIVARTQLFLICGSPATKGWVTTKIYDYLYYRKPILLCPTDENIIEQMVKNANAGYVTHTLKETTELLLRLVAEFSKSGTIAFNPDVELISSYTRKKQTEKLAGILDKLAGDNIQSDIAPPGSVNRKGLTKVLILAYDFPPYVSVGGLRPYHWCKDLAQFGIFPIVITRQWGNKFKNELDYIAPGDSEHTITETTDLGTIIRTPYFPNLSNKLTLKYGEKRFFILRKMISAYVEFVQWFADKGPKIQLYKSAREQLRISGADLIIATGDPFILFKYARKLSREFQIPWIADYRDAWSQDRNINKLFGIINWTRYFEKKIVADSSAITTVSDFILIHLKKIFPKKKIEIISNGYDSTIPDLIRKASPPSDVLHIAYPGTIYKWHPINVFFRSVAGFINVRPECKIQINLYGINNPGKIEELVQQKYTELSGHVKIHPKIPNDELAVLLAENHLLLLFNSYSIMGTKIYNYLAVRRPILYCFLNDRESFKLKQKYYPLKDIRFRQENSLKKLIEETNAGISIRDSEHLKETLNDFYNELLKNGSIQCHTKNIDAYTYRAQTQKLAGVIFELLKAKSAEV